MLILYWSDMTTERHPDFKNNRTIKQGVLQEQKYLRIGVAMREERRKRHEMMQELGDGEIAEWQTNCKLYRII